MLRAGPCSILTQGRPANLSMKVSREMVERKGTEASLRPPSPSTCLILDRNKWTDRCRRNLTVAAVTVEGMDRSSMVLGIRCAVSNSTTILRMVLRGEAEINRQVRAAVAILADCVAKKGILCASATKLLRSTMLVGDVVRKDIGRIVALNQKRQGVVAIVEAAVGVALRATTP